MSIAGGKTTGSPARPTGDGSRQGAPRSVASYRRPPYWGRWLRRRSFSWLTSKRSRLVRGSSRFLLRFLSTSAEWLLGDAEPSEVAEATAVVAFVTQPRGTHLLPQIANRHHVWVRLPLPDDQSSTRLQHSTELSKRPALVRDLTECGDQECGIERRVW